MESGIWIFDLVVDCGWSHFVTYEVRWGVRTRSKKRWAGFALATRRSEHLHRTTHVRTWCVHLIRNYMRMLLCVFKINNRWPYKRHTYHNYFLKWGRVLGESNVLILLIFCGLQPSAYACAFCVCICVLRSCLAPGIGIKGRCAHNPNGVCDEGFISSDVIWSLVAIHHLWVSSNSINGMASSSSTSPIMNDHSGGPPIHHADGVPENVYSRHSTWVHPALALQNQLAPAYHNQFPALSWRKGKWTEEEEFYAKKLIDAFNGGYLKVSSGTTLRSFLAERLCW